MRERQQKGFSFNPTNQRNPSNGKFNHRPLTLKLYGLLSVLVLTLVLIGVLEFANRTLPKGSNKLQYKSNLRIRNDDNNRVVKRVVPRTDEGNLSTISVDTSSLSDASTSTSETSTEASSVITLDTTSAGPDAETTTETTAAAETIIAETTTAHSSVITLDSASLDPITPPLTGTPESSQTPTTKGIEPQITTPESGKTTTSTLFGTSTLDPEPTNSTSVDDTKTSTPSGTPHGSTLDSEPTNSSSIDDPSTSTVLDTTPGPTLDPEPTDPPTTDEAPPTSTDSEVPSFTNLEDPPSPDLESDIDLFIPATITQTLSPSGACAPVPSAAPTCTCPTNKEVPSCTCIPSPTVQFCTCTILSSCLCPETGSHDCFCQQCVCPLDSQCRECLCASGIGSFYMPCECPADPETEGCTMRTMQSDCNVGDPECPCAFVEEWRCGVEVGLRKLTACNVVPTFPTLVVTNTTVVANTLTAVVDTLVVTTTTVFANTSTMVVDTPSVTQTMAPNACGPVATSCACPPSADFSFCTCISDSTVDSCTCTQALRGTCACSEIEPDSGCVCGLCTCLQDKCQKCLCESTSGSLQLCECPADPQGECSGEIRVREPECDVDNPDKCACDSIREWTCGAEVISAGCGVKTLPNTTVVVPPVDTPSAAPPNSTVSPSASIRVLNSTSSFSNTMAASVLVDTPSTISPTPAQKLQSASSPSLPSLSFPPSPPPPTIVALVPVPLTAPPVTLTIISIPPMTGSSTPVPLTLTVTGLSPVAIPTAVVTPVVPISPVAPPSPASPLSSVASPPPEAPPLSLAPTSSAAPLSSVAPPSSAAPLLPVASPSLVDPPLSVAPPSSAPLSSVVPLSSAAPFSSVAPPLPAVPPSPVAPPSSQVPLSSGSPPTLTIPPAPAQAPPPSGSIFILTTDSQGQPITIPATLPAPNTPSPVLSNQPSPTSPIPGGIFFVSSSLSMDSLGLAHIVPVTFLTQSLSSSASVIMGPKGELYTIPTTLLATINPTDVPTAASPGSGDDGGRGGSGNVVGDGGGGGGGGGGKNDKPGSEPVAIFTWPMSKTFLGGYMAILVARLYHMGWTALHTQINDLVPFSQLASPSSATASTLFSSGLSTWYSWLGFGAVWVMSPLAAESIFFDTNYGCPNPNTKSPNNPCWPPQMSVNTGIVRTLQVLLFIVAVVIVATAVTWFHKPSGCSGDPTSIAAIAALMGHPDVERDFRDLDTEISTKELKKQLKEKKYKLGNYRTTAGTEQYGIIPASDNDMQEIRLVLQEIDSGSSTSRGVGKFSFASRWKNLTLWIDGQFFCFLLGILGVTTVYVKAVNNSSLAKVFESRSIGRRLLFALLGCLVSLGWGCLGKESQTLSLYMHLNQPNARPTATILLRKRTLPITAFFPMLRNQHFTAASIAFTSLLSEFLVVTLSGLPYCPGQLREEFLFCGIMSLMILAMMLIMLCVVNIWRLFLPHLLRKPDSVAAVMTYVCESRINADFKGLERVSVSQRDREIVQLGKRYRYGLRRRADGGTRWVVDETGETQKGAGGRQEGLG